ncbi:MAG: alpha/beta hydrolase [Chloroflexi bacterium]|nr:alpha/beta hydrolase [Chloroflexota bacterium]
MTVPTLTGITARRITSARLTTRVLFSGADSGTPVLFLHGNLSSATFFEELMLALPPGFRGIAPDHRGYGDAEPDKKIDATRGLGDLADDAAALLDALHIDKAHIVGHSLGGAVVWRLLLDHPQRFLSVTQIAPGSPYGFGGSKDAEGTPCWEDSAGSGAGLVNQTFAGLLAKGDRSTDTPLFSPRIVMKRMWRPGFVPAREEDILSSMLSIHCGPQDYPGDFVASPNWPGIAPGVWGPNNALSPKYQGDISRLYHIQPKPPLLWIRGSLDSSVSDESMADMGTLGKMGLIPGYPGEAVYPPQPMLQQTRAVLEKYKAAGGHYEEVVIEDAAHVPYMEQPEAFNRAFFAHLARA